MDKLNNWAESKMRSDDLVHALGDDETSQRNVSEQVTKKGLILLTNCQNCGRQWKGIITWGEMCMHFLGQAVPGTRKVRDGVYMACQCNGCQQSTPVMMLWEEVRVYVDAGIRAGCIDAKIRQAVPR